MLRDFTTTARCPACGRRHYTRRKATTLSPAPLLDWAEQQPWPPASVPTRSAPPVPVLLLHGCLDCDGQPMPAVMMPGRRSPVVFRTMAAALAAARSLEAPR